ncbi:MAG TPA: SCO family protein [Opitutaceae bacterium]|jgi:protein SCO1/2
MSANAARQAAACAAALLLVAACARKTEAPKVAGETRYPLTGEVISVDAARKMLVVRHNAVEGYMPAMTMEFPVSAGDAATARPHERIRASLVVGKKGSARLEDIWPDDKVALDSIDSGARMLHQDTIAKGGQVYREVGDTVPDFVLFDQNGRVVDGGRYRGKQVMLDFIYSRCPIANMCPLSTTKMIAAQRLAKEAGIANAEFVSITLDPAHDTPGVLKEYAADRGIDTSNFSFLTGPEAAIRDLLTQFGVIAEFRGDILDHTLATLLIDEKGRVSWRADGSEWQPKDFVARMHR